MTRPSTRFDTIKAKGARAGGVLDPMSGLAHRAVTPFEVHPVSPSDMNRAG